MTNVQNSNQSFQRMVNGIRKGMPWLAGSVVLFVYVVSAIAGGKFLAQLMGAAALAYSIGGAIQITRATLVFFPQLNPTRPILNYTSEVIAVLMGVLSIIEIVGLVSWTEMAPPVAVSLSILMAAGVAAELFLLREIRFITELQLFSNREWWIELQAFYRSRADFRYFMEGLQNEEAGIQVPVVRTAQVPQAARPALRPSPTPLARPELPAASKPAKTNSPVEDADDKMQQERYLRAARNFLKASIDHEAVNNHEEAAQDDTTAEGYIALAYPEANDQERAKIKKGLIDELNTKKMVRPLDLTGAANGQQH